MLDIKRQIYSTRVKFRDELVPLADIEVVSVHRLLVDLNKNEGETRSLVILNDAVSREFLFRDASKMRCRKPKLYPR